MRLTGKDVAATLFTGLAVAVYVAFLNGATWPLIQSVRGTAGVILALGWVGGCALSSAGEMYAGQTKASGGLIAALTTVGVVALVGAVVALTTANEFALGVLVVATVLLWLGATLRHVFSRPRGEPADVAAPDRTSTTV
jgi:hypothetical protein